MQILFFFFFFFFFFCFFFFFAFAFANVEKKILKTFFIYIFVQNLETFLWRGASNKKLCFDVLDKHIKKNVNSCVFEI